MTETIEIYVKNTSNCNGMPLTFFEQLSESWNGDSLRLPFGEGDERETYPVVGWTDLFFGSATIVCVAKVRAPEGEVGYLVYGGNSGVRVLDESAEVQPWNEHLPRGYGMPVVWVAEDDLQDLPEEVQQVVSVQKEF